MFWVLILGILSVVMMVSFGVGISDFFYKPEEVFRSFRWMDTIPVVVQVICVLLMFGMFCFALSEHVASNVGYNSSKYQMEKKITTSEGGCTNEADTVYFFVRKSNN